MSIFLTIKSIDLNEKGVSQTVDIGYMPTPVVVKSKNALQGKMIQKIDVQAFIHHSGSELEKQDILNMIRSATMPYQSQINISFKVRSAPKIIEDKKKIPEASLLEQIQKNLIEESERLYDLFQVLIVFAFVGLFALILPLQIKSIMKTFFENKTKTQSALRQLNQNHEKKAETPEKLDEKTFKAFKEVMLTFPKSFRHFFISSSAEEKLMLANAVSLLAPAELQTVKPFIYDLFGKVDANQIKDIDFTIFNSWLEKITRTITIADSVDRKIIEDFLSHEDFVKISSLNIDDLIKIGNRLKNPSAWTIITLSNGPEESFRILSEISNEMRIKVMSNPDLDLKLINQAASDIIKQIGELTAGGASRISHEITTSFCRMLESKSDEEAEIILNGIKDSNNGLFESLNQLYWPVKKIASLEFQLVKTLFNELNIEEKTSLFLGVGNEARDQFLKCADKKLQILLVDALERQQKHPSLDVKKRSLKSARDFIKTCQKNSFESSTNAA